MSTFAALNIEADETPEEEIDDTREIQIEEALKLYQTALKLHSQGPKHYKEAAEAYDALFKSEIFKFPQYADLGAAISEDEYIEEVDGPSAVSIAAADEAETAASALPQTLYLSYKNYGQFLLDTVRYAWEQGGDLADTASSTESAIRHFADALERDDSDLELWRKCARVGDSLRSHRILRFCLESVFEGNGDGIDDGFEQLGIEQAGAVGDLRKFFTALHDPVSLAQLPHKQPRRALLNFLQRQIDPFPYLPSALKQLNGGSISCGLGLPATKHHTITPTTNSWAALGEKILELLSGDGLGQDTVGVQGTMKICLPDSDVAMTSPAATLPIIQGRRSSKHRNSIIADSGDPEETAANESMPTADENTDPKEDEKADGKTGENTHGDTNKEQEDEKTVDKDREETEKPNEPVDETEARPGPQTRKRSSASIVNEEPTDGGRTKSKRIRARESIADTQAQPEEVIFDQTRYFEDRLEIYTHADEWMFSTANSLFSKFGVEELGSVDQIKQMLAPTGSGQHTTESSPEYLAVHDLRHIIENWNDGLSKVALHSDIFADTQDGLKGVKKSGLSVFLEHSKQVGAKAEREGDLVDDQGLEQFANNINASNLTMQEVAFKWLEKYLKPDLQSLGHDISTVTDSIYATQQMCQSARDTLTQILLRLDGFIYNRLREFALNLERRILSSAHETPYSFTPDDLIAVEMSQSIYELHLDIYDSIVCQNEKNQGAAILQQDRLSRWRSLTRGYISYYLDLCIVDHRQTAMVLRHLWATTFHENMLDDQKGDYVLLCLGDIRRALVSLGDPVIALVNNNTMPEISTAAIDQEVSRLRAMSFFTDIFGSGNDDLVHLIETIEPVLDPSAVRYTDENGNISEEAKPSTTTQNLIDFLNQGDATLKLFLWRRLREAYDSIDYPTKVVSCHLRSLEAVVQELNRPARTQLPVNERRSSLLKWLKLSDDILTSVMRRVVNKPEVSFECFDWNHLQISMSSLARLSRILQSFALYEDGVRVGQITPADIRPASTAKSLEQFKDKLRSLFVKIWIVQYTLLREGINQNNELFDTPLDDRIHFLRSIHNALGLRSYCKYPKNLFVKLMRDELLTLKTDDVYEDDLAQVLYDLYKFKFSPHLDVSFDHGCPYETLDQEIALKLVDFTLTQTKRIDIKDYLKSDLKTTVDALQRQIGLMGKSELATPLNKRILSKFLKTPINPLELFRSVQGVSGLSMIPVYSKSSDLADKGWFTFLGSAALAKFRAQKKVGPTPTEDLDLAATLFRHDLEHGKDRWESWYRLAQVYDLRLEEEIAWSAEKINNDREDLATVERRAIHAYSMAVATAVQTADLKPDEKKQISDLYTEFGLRVYASTRDPLSMGAFDVTAFMRHFSSGADQRMYEGKPFSAMKPFSAWYFASYLFHKAMKDRPMNWRNHYMFSKCLWKMYCSNDPLKERYKPIEPADILDSLTDAIDVLPKKKDGRSSEPILEPHFKLVSLTHKLVRRGDLEPKDASEKLLATPWARGLSLATDMESWKPFILGVLKQLQNADKSNWHHRIVARAAHIIYDDSKDREAAIAAKNDLTQHIFTKTMTVQVWRPENERAGRHFVYTTRYVYFFVQLLDQLDDRANLDMLVRRVRRKVNDYLNFPKLWEDTCATYIKLLRRAGNIPEGKEDAVFKGVSLDDFTLYSGRLDTWCQNPAKEDIPTIELLRDAVELKKLNGTIIKSGMFDDLVADIYAQLYEKTLPQFVEQVAGEENRERMKVDHLLMPGESADGTETPPALTSVQAPAPRLRAKGVTRKEVQKKSDAIAAKAPRPAPKPAKPAEDEAKQVQTEQQSTDQQTGNETAADPTQVNNKEDKDKDNNEEDKDRKDEEEKEENNEEEEKEGDDNEEREDNNEEEEKDGDNCEDKEASVLDHSVHDTTEIESGLSDIETETASGDAMKPSSPMFQNLLRARMSSPKAGSELSTVVSADGGDNDSIPTPSVQDTKMEIDAETVEAAEGSDTEEQQED
ncbi:Histone transcription regulator 3 [Microsporum ferrugineum]